MIGMWERIAREQATHAPLIVGVYGVMIIRQLGRLALGLRALPSSHQILWPSNFSLSQGKLRTSFMKHVFRALSSKLWLLPLSFMC